MARRVTLVLTTAGAARPLVVEPFAVETPWWPDAEPIVAEAASRLGLDVTVLRLLDATPDPREASGMGGAATYLAEISSEAHATLAHDGGARPWPGSLDDHPLRASWARPGGPGEHLDWADRELVAHGRPRTGPAVQVKTWNLSGLWRLPTAPGPVWLKTVPPFFAHEGPVIAALGGSSVPRLLAADGGRMLLDDVPGEDQWAASTAVVLEMVALLVELQFRWIDRSQDLLALGATDFRAPALAAGAAAVVERAGSQLTAADRRVLEALLRGLGGRFASVEACGIPDALVHGDFHPGNVRGGANELVILDWGDCGVGHPLLDLDAMLARAADTERLRSAWYGHWQRRLPGCDPARAADLLAPVGCLRQAIVYQAFLDGIEPSERRYHEADVPTQLRRAAAVARMSESPYC